jgi:hypothetical protein
MKLPSYARTTDTPRRKSSSGEFFPLLGHLLESPLRAPAMCTLKTARRRPLYGVLTVLAQYVGPQIHAHNGEQDRKDSDLSQYGYLIPNGH